MFPSSYTRVREHTDEEVNRRIQQQTEENIRRYANAERAEIDRRLHELDREWDVERIIETEAAATALTGLALGLGVNRRFLLIPMAVAGFVLLHAVHGWYPLLPLLRRMGVRTAAEIEEERYALKAARGDFDGLDADGATPYTELQKQQLLQAVQL